MPDSKFDLGDYVEVKDRLAKFYELFGMGSIVTEGYELTREPDDKPKVIVTAKAYRTPDDPHPGVGLSWMYLPGSTSYTKGSEIENVETSAWGRAIGSLGILILKSIATGNEIRAKADEDAPQAPATPQDGSLIGVAEVGKPPSDFELRMGPDGSAVSFRLVQGRQSIKVIAKGDLADALVVIRAEVIGKRVVCWGSVAQESFVKDGKTIAYRVLTLDRIQTPDYLLPASEASGQAPEAQAADGGKGEPPASAPIAAFTADELAGVG